MPAGDLEAQDVISSASAHTTRRCVGPVRSGITPEPTVRDETANDSDDSPSDGIQHDHADQQERDHHEGCAALPVAVNPSDHNFGTAD